MSTLTTRPSSALSVSWLPWTACTWPWTFCQLPTAWAAAPVAVADTRPDRKSTRLNSSHEWKSYAVCCLKKKALDLVDLRSGDLDQIRVDLPAGWLTRMTLVDTPGMGSLSESLCLKAPDSPEIYTLSLHDALPI